MHARHDVESLQALEALYAFASLPLNERPAGELLERMLDASYSETMLSFADACCGDHPRTAQGLSLMAEWMRAGRQRPRAEVADELGVDRTRLYRAVSPSYGPEAPYEALWTKARHREQDLLLHLREEYASNGLAVVEGAYERADYLGIELECCRLLVERQVAALLDGDEAGAARAHEAHASFVEEHPRAWVPRFAREALEHARTDYHRGHLMLLEGLMGEFPA